MGQSGTLSKVYRLTPLLANNRVWTVVLCSSRLSAFCIISYSKLLQVNKYVLIEVPVMLSSFQMQEVLQSPFSTIFPSCNDNGFVY